MIPFSKNTPLIPAVCAYILGIIFFFTTRSHTTLQLCIAIALSSLFVLFFFQNMTQKKIFLLATGFFLLAGARLHISNVVRVHYTDIITQSEFLEGTVLEEKNISTYRYGKEITIEVTHPYSWLASYSIKLNTFTPHSGVTSGDTIQFKTKFSNHNIHSSWRHLQDQRDGVVARATIKPDDIRITEGSCLASTSYFDQIHKSLKSKMSSSAFMLYNSLFLGLKQPSAKLQYLQQKWAQLGIAHYLARSGIHIMLLLFLWQIIVSLLPCSTRWQQLILVVISLVYYCASWPSISFNRAFLAALLYLVCKIRLLAINQLHIFSIVCLAALLHNPYALFFLDFQLSYGLTFALLLYSNL